MNKVKTIVTLNKDVNAKEDILKFVEKGVLVFRIDLSSMTYNAASKIIEIINDINKHSSSRIAVMLDIKGPRLSTGKFSGGSAVFKKNDKIRVYPGNILGDKTKFSIEYKTLVDDVEYGSIIKLAGGVVTLKVIDKANDDSALICEVIKGGKIENHSNVNIPDNNLKIKFMSTKTKEDISFASKVSADYLALSFISGVDDVLDVNDLLIECGNDHTAIISKIENEQALEELDEILNISEGIIIARSDLGTELPIERIPGIQKIIINKCHLKGKTSIVSTDIFTDSIDAPSRAEVSDIANAVLDGTDAVILGINPVYNDNSIDVLDAINKVISTAEKDIEYMDFYDKSVRSEEQDITGNIVSSVTYMSIKLKSSAIVVPTNSGIIAKKISRFRPSCPIFALTTDEMVAKNLLLNFGIYPVLINESHSIDDIIKGSKELVKKVMPLEKGNKIIITGGYPLNNSKYTNLIEIEEI